MRNLCRFPVIFHVLLFDLNLSPSHSHSFLLLRPFSDLKSAHASFPNQARLHSSLLCRAAFFIIYISDQCGRVVRGCLFAVLYRFVCRISVLLIFLCYVIIFSPCLKLKLYFLCHLHFGSLFVSLIYFLCFGLLN